MSFVSSYDNDLSYVSIFVLLYSGDNTPSSLFNKTISGCQSPNSFILDILFLLLVFVCAAGGMRAERGQNVHAMRPYHWRNLGMGQSPSAGGDAKRLEHHIWVWLH